MKILFITNLPSPYRVSFFNELGKKCELTVCFERHSASNRDAKWINSDTKNFREIYAEVKPFGHDQSKGKGIVKVLKRESFDHLIISGYASPSVIWAIVYCKLRKIPYYIESDGAFYKKDGFLKKAAKKFLFCGAKAHLTTCEEHIRYLLSMGIPKEQIHKYRFTSLAGQDILVSPVDVTEKQTLRNALNITEEKMVISVGQFIRRKGYDILLEACRTVSSTVGVYIIGGKPTAEYLEMKEKYRLNNVHFIDFMNKEQLREWYMAADCFVLPTRDDIWGLVVNEAMACGLPVITTTRCIAGLELIQNGINGYIIENENAEQLSEKINVIIQNDALRAEMSINALQRIAEYNFENMADDHFVAL